MIFLYTKDKGRILITGNKSVMIVKTKLVSETYNGQEINYDTVLMIRTLNKFKDFGNVNVTLKIFKKNSLALCSIVRLGT